MEDKINGNVQNRVAQLRRECGLSQRELGDLLYLDQRTVSHIESGNCTLANLVAIADVFGVSLDYILMRSNDQEFTLGAWDKLDIAILSQVRKCTDAEKERLLKHLELEQSLKANSRS